MFPTASTRKIKTANQGTIRARLHKGSAAWLAMSLGSKTGSTIIKFQVSRSPRSSTPPKQTGVKTTSMNGSDWRNKRLRLATSCMKNVRKHTALMFRAGLQRMTTTTPKVKRISNFRAVRRHMSRDLGRRKLVRAKCKWFSGKLTSTNTTKEKFCQIQPSLNLIIWIQTYPKTLKWLWTQKK